MPLLTSDQRLNANCTVRDAIIFYDNRNCAQCRKTERCPLVTLEAKKKKPTTRAGLFKLCGVNAAFFFFVKT